MADPGASSQPDPAPSSESRSEEDDSEPKFQLTASLMKQIDPVTLHVHQTDKITMQAVQLFSNNVILILHTCNKNEYWAALEKLEPPTTEDKSNIRDRPIIYPQIGSVIGWFAGYRAAVVKTRQGNKCRDELTNAVTKSFPNGQVIIAAGIAYANDQKRKFADVLISDQIENFVQYKKTGNEITNHGPRVEVDLNVQRIFEDSARDWTDMKNFICAVDNRTSVAHIGCIVSAPTLVKDEILRDQLMKHTPNAIGGEMEGWVLLELKRTLKGQHDKDIEVIIIKGVADYGDLSKGDKWQWTAAKAAMDCIHYCLNKSGGIEFTGDVPLPQDPPESECVGRYAQYLKNRYEGMPTLPEGDWPPSLGRQFTRLAMIERDRKLHSTDSEATVKRDCIRGNIDRIVKRKKAVKLPEIFLPPEDAGQQLKILMDGAPGVGKSTLCRKICKDWASGELLKQYHLVILLPLRQASIREATSIESLIEADDPYLKQHPDLKKQVVQHIWRTFGEHVMLIVDGYDELSYEDRKKKNSLFLDIVQGKQFPKSSVLVTSRPYASGYLQHLPSINRHVEVLGFTDEQIEQCITVHETIPDKFKSELVQTLKERQDIASLCYIPLNCAIVLCVYEVEDFTLPNNLTKLYEIFVLNTIKRRITDNDSITTMAEIPESVQKDLDALSKLAYDGLVADKMVFSVKNIRTAFPNCHDLDVSDNLLSLMTVFKGFTSTGVELSYHFLHLTIQEFLAASWAASQLSASELLKFFQDHLREDRYRMVLLFLAGISQLNFPSVEDLFRETLDFKGQDSRQYSNREVVDYFLFFAHLIYESHNFNLFHNLSSTIMGAELFTTSYRIAPFDCLVLAHFLAWCSCSLKSLNLSNCGLTSESLEIMHQVNLQHCGTTEIEEVDLSNNPKVITKLSLLSKLPMFEHTKVLKACGLQCPVEASCVVDLLCLLNMRYLITLKVSAKALSSYFPPLDKIYLSLDTFLFENGNIDSQNAVGIFKSLEHNTSLEKLDLSENSQLAEGDSWAVGCAVEKMLNVNKTLKRLNLSSCELDTVVATSIFRSLAHNISLEELDLSENNQLGDSEAVGCAIERMFSVNQTLKVLTLCSCELDTAVATSIFRSLEHNTSLEELDLSENNQVGDSEAVGCAIERMLNLNTKLRVLNLQGCGITDPVAKHISTGLINSRSLVTLDIEPCTLSVSCAVSLHQQVITHPTVKITVGEVNILGVGRVKTDNGSIWCGDYFGPVFHLSLNKLRCQGMKIDSQNAVDIFRSLEQNTSLEELDLSENHQLAEGNSEAVGCAIERMLTVNKTLKVLNLSKCKLDTVVATTIFSSLQHNISLEKLHLSQNNQLGDSEAVGCAIERMLNVNRKLKVLNLQGCEITDPVAKHISTGLINSRSLVTLDIEPCTLSVSCAVSLHQQVITHPTVKITVGEVNILGVGRVKTDKGTIWCGNPVFHLSLNKLRCQGMKIDSQNAVDIFRSLEQNTSLEELDLSENRQLSEGDSEAVGCAIERMLTVNKTLKVLNLSKCKLDTVVATTIFSSIQHNISLEKLHLSQNNQLGDSEAVGCAIERMLTVNKTLKVLNLSKCKLDTVVATTIFSSLQHNISLEKLHLSQNNQLGDSEAVGCAIERMLNVNRKLKVLNLQGCEITDPVAKHISTGLINSRSLVTLDIEPCTLSVSCAVSLHKQVITHPTVKITVGEVNILGVGRVKTDKGTIWCGNPVFHLSLNKLRCQGVKIDSQNAVDIFRSLEHNTSLEELDLSENRQLSEGDSEAVGCAIERILNVNGTLKALNLSKCKLDTAVATSIFRSLEHNTSLEELDLSENSQLAEGDSEAVGCAIERILNVNGTLKALNLSKCKLDTAVATSIFRSLEHNTSLEELDLSENSQLAEGDSEAVGCAIERILNVNGTLKVLNLSKCKLDTAVATSIFRSLEHNTSLEELDLSENNLLTKGDSEAVGCAIERMLNVNKTIKVLHLSGCKLDTAVATSIFRSLEHNTSLEELDLSENNQVGDSEAVGCAIERMLNLNTKLTVLNLHGCGITDPVAKHISTGLINSRSLVTLDIEPCTLSVSCAVSLHQQVITHPTVKITVGEVNILGVGRVKTDNGSIWCGNPVFHLSLNKLRCQGVKIDSQNAVDIFRSLEHNTSLEELDLSENSQLPEGDSEAVGYAIEKLLNVNTTLKRLNLSGCNLTDPIVKRILMGLNKNTSLVTLNVGSPKLSGSCAVSLFQQMTTHPTVSITVGEVNVLGVGRVKMDRYSMVWCVTGDLIPENCVEFFRALNNSGLKVSKLNVQDLTDQTAEYFAVGLAESQSVQALKVLHCNIGSAGAVSIFRSLEHNNLEELDLSGNSQLAVCDSEVVGCAIERMLNVNRTLKVLNLTECGFTSEVASYFGNGLAQNHSVRKITLHWNNIGSTGAVSIFKSLEHNTSLKELDLSGNRQLAEDDSEAVGCAIERMLNVNRTLKVLDLWGCKVTDPIVKHILTGLTKNTSLVALNMSLPTLSVSCAVSLFQQMTTHPTVSITVGEVNVLGVGRVKMDRYSMVWCVTGDLIPENCVEFFRALNNSGLKVSKLNVQDLTDQTAEYFAVGLAESQSVQALKVLHCNIGSAGAVSIFRSLEHNNLEELDLSGNSQLAVCDSEVVGCAIERMLNVNRTLKVLNLTECGFTSEVASHFAKGLAQNHSVRKITLHWNNIGSTGAVSIFRSLEHNTSLEELDLSGNRQLAEDDSEAVGCAIERMLNVNRTLKVLGLWGCKVTDPIVKHILTGLTKNTSLVELKMSLPTLSVSCAVSLFQQMTTHPTVSIIVGEVNVLGVGRVTMDRYSMVWCVMYTGNLIPKNFVEFFRVLSSSGLKVSKLNVQDLTDQTAEHFAVGLAESQSVQALKVLHCNIGSAGAVSIFRSLEHNNLEELDLSGNSQLAVCDSEVVGCAIERMLNVNRTLKVLNLTECGFTSEVASYFGNGLAQNHSVRKVILHWNNIGSTGAVSIFRSLEHNTSLEELDLSWNKQLAEGDSEAVGCAIERMLNVNRTLKVLNLSDCRLYTTVITHTAAGLAHNVSLAELNIGASIWNRNNITNEGWVHLFKALCNNTSLKKLDISSNKIGVKGSEALAEMLSCNKSLTELDLRRCNIPEAGLTEILAKGLLHNTSLKKLNISNNKLGMEGSVALADTLSCNKSLTELNLQWFNIPEAGLTEILAKGLLHNTSLKKLNISGNKLGMEGSVALADMLSCNNSLTELNLGGCGIPEAGLREIARGLLTNTSLQTIVIALTQDKTFLEEEIERLKKSGNFKSQRLRKIEIKARW